MRSRARTLRSDRRGQHLNSLPTGKENEADSWGELKGWALPKQGARFLLEYTKRRGFAGAVAIDLVARQVVQAGQEVRLTPKEYGFLAELAKHPGRVLTHAHLLRAMSGPAHVSDVEYLRVAARGIRKKLEVDPASPVLNRNEPGVGYRLMTG